MGFSVARGDTMGDQADYPVADWRNEVNYGDTRLGYREWVQAQRDAADNHY